MLAGLVAAAALAVPAQAGAASVGINDGTLWVHSGVTEASTLTVTRSGSTFVVTDAQLSIWAFWGAGCSPSGSKSVVCPADGVTGFSASLGDGDDSIDTTGVSLPATINVGDGDDTLLVRNATADSIDCGTGADRGLVDSDDVLSADCESTLERPFVAPPAQDPPVTTDPGTPVEDPPAEQVEEVEAGKDRSQAPVAIRTPSTVRMTGGGALPIAVACTADAGKCTGSIEIVEEAGTIKARTAVESARRRKPKKKKATVLGRGKFAVAAGKRKTVTVRLSRRGRQRIIKKKKKRKTRAKIVVSMRAPDGTVSKTEKKVSITAPKPRRSTRRGSGRKSPGKKGQRR
jgi:hypothetical protein